MMHLPASVRVYLCASVCDMRKSFDGLHALVAQSMELDAKPVGDLNEIRSMM